MFTSYDDIYQEEIVAALSNVPIIYGFNYDFDRSEETNAYNYVTNDFYIDRSTCLPVKSNVNQPTPTDEVLLQELDDIPRFHGFSYDFENNDSDDVGISTCSLINSRISASSEVTCVS